MPISLLALGAILTFAALLPTLGSGLAGDDIYRAHLVAVEKLHGWTNMQLIDHVSAELAAEHGGFFPLRSWPLWIWLADPGPPLAHFIQIIVIAVNLVTYLSLILRLTESRALCFMTLSLFCLSLQIRIPNDAIIGTLFLQPLILECVLLAILGWLLYQKNHNTRWIIFAFIAYLGAICCDEWTYAIAPIFLLLSHSAVEKRISCIFFVPPIASLAAGCFGLTTLPVSYHRIVDDMRAAGSYWYHIAIQLLAPLPLIFRSAGNAVSERRSLFTPQGDQRFLIIPSLTLWGWMVACSVSSLIYAACKRLPGDVLQSSWRRATIVALSLWIIPTIFAVANPQEWQRGLPLGESYSGAYPLSFGFALAAAIVLTSLFARLRKQSPQAWLSATAVLAFGAFLIEYGNQRVEALIVQKYAKLDLPRSQIAEAAEASVFSKIPDGDRIVVAASYPFRFRDPDYRNARYIFSHYSGKRYEVASSVQIEPGGALCLAPNPVHCAPRLSNTWFLRLEQPVHNIFEPALAFARWKYSDGQEIYTDDAVGYRAYGVANVSQEATREVRASLRGVHITAHEIRPNTLLLHAVRICGPVPVQQAFAPEENRIRWLGFFPLTNATSVRIAGVVNDVHLPQPEARIAGTQSVLLIERDHCRPAMMAFQAKVFTETPATLWVTVGKERSAFSINALGTVVKVLIPPTLGQKFAIQFSTNASSISPFVYGPRDDTQQFLDPRMVVAFPVLKPAVR